MMQQKLTWLAEELQASVLELMGKVRQLEGAPQEVQRQLLNQSDSLLASVSGAITIAAQEDSSVPIYISVLRKLLQTWPPKDQHIIAQHRQTIEIACQTLHDYLEALRTHEAYSELALFPTYAAMCNLILAAPHPMHLWPLRIDRAAEQLLNASSVKALMRSSAQARMAFISTQDQARHWTQMERTILFVLRPTEIKTDYLQALASGSILCDMRMCDPSSEASSVVGGALLRCVFESIASGDLILDIWLKRVLLASLDWFKLRADCPTQELAFFAYVAWQKQLAQGKTSPPELAELAAWCDWQQIQGANYQHITLGQKPGAQVEPFLSQLAASNKALAMWSANGTDSALFEASTQSLATSLSSLHARAEPLAYELSNIQGAAALQSRALLIELATTYLTLEAMVAQLHNTPSTQLSEQFSELARRLKVSRDGQAAGALAPWMLAMQQSQTSLHALDQMTQEMRSRVVELETAFTHKNYPRVAELVGQLTAVAQVIHWPLFAKGAASVLAAVQTLPHLNDVDGSITTANITHNIAAMGLLVEMQSQGTRESLDLLTFDEPSGRFIMLDRSPSATQAIKPTADQGISAEDNGDTDDDDLVALFHEEASEVLDQATAACTVLEQRPDSWEHAVSLRRSFHTLKGGARMARLLEFAEYAWEAEQQLNLLLSEKQPPSTAFLQQIRHAIQRLRAQIPTSTPLPLPAIEQPSDWLDLHDTPPAVATKTIGDITISHALYNAFLNEADEWSRRLASALSEWAIDDAHPPLAEALHWAHALAGSSATVGFTQLSVLAKTTEQLLERVGQGHFHHADLAQQLVKGADEMRRILHQFAAGFLKDPDASLLAQLQWLLQQPDDVQSVPDVPDVPVVTIVPVAPVTPSSADSQEHTLAAIFAEEAAVLMPNLGMALRFWLLSPERVDQLEQRAQALRVLHTLKGSARLAEQWKLADQSHLLESAIESYAHAPSPEQSAALLAQYDAMHIQEIAQPADIASIHPASLLITATEAGTLMEPASQPSTPLLAPPATPAPARAILTVPGLPPATLPPASGDVIRVKLGLIDRLINESGEIMIARARMQAEVQRSQHTLGEMSKQVVRLREQLRELELQTESQMQSRQAQVSDQAQVFDPLEFDRFTRTQELTRFMAEALGDISTLQRSLLRGLNATEDDLAAQSRQARDLQRNLLQTRMVAFDSIAERLHRLVRVTSQELSKSVELSIHGGLQEMDRSVLERVIPAFEHLLRNAIVHAIEPSAQRIAAGKPSAGQIRIDLTQHGNDVFVTVKDDGRGLDVEAVKAKAASLDPAVVNTLDSADPAQLIFISGLSTAHNVSELAGRGIGMDVVKAQVLALGGRIEVDTQTGVGTAFRLILPLTTAVTQIVLVRTGNVMTALPANLVQSIVRAKPDQLEQAHRCGEWPLENQPCPFYTLGHLLQERSQAPLSAQNKPQTALQSVILLNSSNQMMALWVDEVLGNQEVVVKNLGPQLAQMPGLAGMTVLPTGETVLIYNPVALATLYGVRLKAAQTTAAAQAGHNPQADSGTLATDKASVTPLAPLVLAVDDSITMRRVLQRLLLREGYRVVQAADGKQALEVLRIEIPTLILSDVEMPRMDGFELLKQIRSSERMRAIPVVMITSRIADKHREHAKSLGANAYLGKPYSEEELIALLGQYAPL
jgi:chemotaxis protein histidine kinase CheA